MTTFDMLQVTEILLSDGWHDVVPGSMFADNGMTFTGPPGTAPITPAGTWIAFTSLSNGKYYALPLSPFTVVRYTPAAPVPAVTGITPSTGSHLGGTTVTVNGSGLAFVNAVKFGTTPSATVTIVNDTQVTAVAPAVAAGVVDVTVTSTGGTSATLPADQFTYT